MKQFLTMAWTLLMAVAMQGQTYWNGTSNKTFSGSGTEADPYLISTPEQLAGLAERVNTDKEDFAGQYIKLTADIYLTNFNDTDTASWPQWEPIGHHHWEGMDNGFRDTCFFRGHFDGDGHTVYNMFYGGGLGWGDSINLNPYDWENNNMEELENLEYTSWYRGLFGFVKDGSIENVSVENATLCGIYISPLVTYVGANAVVRNCHAKNNTMLSTTGTNYAFINANLGLIENCSVEGDYSNCSVGLVGTNCPGGIIRDCSANVSSSRGSFYAITSSNQGLIERTHSVVDITTSGASQGSGFVYSNADDGIIRDCYSSGSLRGGGNDIARWSAIIAGFCIINTGTLESCYSTCDLTDTGIAGGGDNAHVKMAGFVFANGIWPIYAGDTPIPGVSINCFFAGSLAFSNYADNCAVNTFLAGYAGSTNTYASYGVPSKQINCFWNETGFPVTLDKNQAPVGEGVTLAYMQSQAFVDELNRMATFMGTSQWEYRAGQLPRATGVRIQDKSLFFAQGNGTEANPYLITNKTDLETLAELTNKGYDFRNEYFKQTADIELNAPFEQWGEIAPTKWQAIGCEHSHTKYSGTYPTYFLGNYDGDFHEVKNMYINSTLPTLGLFGYAGGPFAKERSLGDQYIKPTVIRNLGVTDVYVRASGGGGVVGNLGNQSDLIQCWSSGAIYAVTSNNTAPIAGLVSIVNRNTRLLNCQSSVSLTPASGSTECLSFSGELGSSLFDTIVNAFYSGTTKQYEFGYAYSKAWYGYTENVFRDTTTTQYKNLNAAEMCSTERMQSKELVNILNATVTAWNNTHSEERPLDYWEWRENDYPRVSPNAASQFVTVTFESNGGSAILPMSVVPNSQIVPPARPTKEGNIFAAWYRDAACTDFFDFKRDSVTADMTLYARWLTDTREDYDLTPFQNEFATTYHIKTAAQLRGLVAMVSGVYDWTNFPFGNTYLPPVLVAPIDFTGKTVVLDNDIFLNDTTDWQHWGNHCYAVPWTPIGYCPGGANLNPDNLAFKGTFDGQGHVVYGMYMETWAIPSSDVGLFARLIGGTIRNVGVEASVIDLRNHKDNPWPYQGEEGTAAGLLLLNMENGTIEQSYAKGKIIPHEQTLGYPDIGDTGYGGLIGSDAVLVWGKNNAGSITNCYAMVDIIRERYDDLKGYSLCGWPRTSDNANKSYTNCYSAGRTSQGNNIATTYYNKELVTTTATNACAKSTYEMHTMNAYANWDFNTIWGRNDSINDGYPFLRIFHPGVQNSPDPVTVTGITLQETTADIILGDTLQLHASVLPADAVNQKINWTSSNTNYAIVNENGVVTALKYSSNPVIITATTDDGGYSKKCSLTIQTPSVTFQSTPLYYRRIGDAIWKEGKDANTYYTLNYEYLIAAYSSPNAAHNPFTWQSSNEAAITVEPYVDDTILTIYSYAYSRNIDYRSSIALIRCVGTGTSTITATNSKYNKTSTRSYRVEQYDVTGITLYHMSGSSLVSGSVSVDMGTTGSLKAFTTPATTSFVPVITWSSSAPGIVSVDENGQYEALTPGTATITATYGTATATLTITVKPIEVTGVAMSETSITLYKGNTYQLSASVLPENATNKTITWSTTSTTYATVDQNGLVTAKRKGSATVRATAANGKYATCSVSILESVAATGISLNRTSATMSVGETLQLTATLTPSNATTQVVWSSSDENVASVSADGLITANTAGSATITATAGSKSASCVITVQSSTFYTITFVDEDGVTELWSTQVREGTMPVYSGLAPAKDPTVSTVYTFAGWSPALAPATSDATYTATYTETARTYTIRFINWNGSVLQSSAVAYNETPVYTGATPAKPSDDENSYAFSGWQPEITAVTADADYTAQFEATAIQYYTIRFLNYDGTVLQSESLKQGTMPVYTGATPAKPSDEQYTYAFSGWSPTIVAATADADYTAQFEANEIPVIACNDIDVTWLQTGGSGFGAMTTDDASVWKYDAQYGAKATKQGSYTAHLMTPAKDLSGMESVTLSFQHTHKFAGTPSNELTLWVTADYKGSYAASAWQQLTISPYAANTNWTFVSVTINVPVSLVGANTVFAFQYTSTTSAYATWEIKDLHLVAECAGTTPPEQTYYTVRFLNYDGAELQSSQVKEGDIPAYTGATPVREEDANYTYTFSGWSPSIVTATSDADYTAQFTSTRKSQGLEDVQSDDVQCTKILRNGQIYILRGERVYTLQGQEVK